MIAPVVVKGYTARNPATGTVGWQRLMGIPRGTRGYVEVRSFDTFAEVRLVRQLTTEGNDVVDREQDTRPIRLGPGGMAHCFDLGDVVDGATVEYRVMGVVSNATHVDPTTGIYATVTTRDTRITGRWSATKPDTRTTQAIQVYASYGDTSAAASSTSVRLFPTGYARNYTITCGQTGPIGTLGIRTGNPASLGPGNTFDALTGSRLLEPIMTGTLGGWDCITLTNDDSTAELIASVLFTSPDGR